MATGNYYELLGVTQQATREEIRKAFRKKALPFHPDRNSSAEAEVKYRDLLAAYTVLEDTTKRQLYDTYGNEWETHIDENGDIKAPPPAADNFQNIFDQFFPQQGRRNPAPSEPTTEKINHTNFQLGITLQQFYTGVTKKLAAKRAVLCRLCFGRGRQCLNCGKNGPDHLCLCPKESGNQNPERCLACNGAGTRLVTRNIGPGMVQQVQQNCDVCQGRGRTDKYQCQRCHGTGTEFQKEVLVIEVLSGMSVGQKFRFAGREQQKRDLKQQLNVMWRLLLDTTPLSALETNLTAQYLIPNYSHLPTPLTKTGDIIIELTEKETDSKDKTDTKTDSKKEESRETLSTHEVDVLNQLIEMGFAKKAAKKAILDNPKWAKDNNFEKLIEYISANPSPEDSNEGKGKEKEKEKEKETKAEEKKEEAPKKEEEVPKKEELRIAHLRRHGESSADLFHYHKITLSEALFGFTFSIHHFDGRLLTIKSPSGVVFKTGDQIIAPNEGMPIYQHQPSSQNSTNENKDSNPDGISDLPDSSSTSSSSNSSSSSVSSTTSSTKRGNLIISLVLELPTSEQLASLDERSRQELKTLLAALHPASTSTSTHIPETTSSTSTSTSTSTDEEKKIPILIQALPHGISPSTALPPNHDEPDIPELGDAPDPDEPKPKKSGGGGGGADGTQCRQQ